MKSLIIFRPGDEIFVTNLYQLLRTIIISIKDYGVFYVAKCIMLRQWISDFFYLIALTYFFGHVFGNQLQK